MSTENYLPSVFPVPVTSHVKTNGSIVNPADGINSDGSQNVQLIGRNSVVIPIFNSLSIRDTIGHVSTSIDLSPYSRVSIIVNNNLNQSVKVNLLDSNMISDQITISNATGNTPISVTVASGGFITVITPSDMPALGSPLQSIRLSLSCSIAPTSGLVTVKVIGLPN